MSAEASIERLTALREMARKLGTRDTASHFQSSEWTRLTNRGGPYHVEDTLSSFALEHLADKELLPFSRQKEKELRDQLSWIGDDDEDVQFMWCMVSLITIEKEDVRQSLLREIAHLWITT